MTPISVEGNIDQAGRATVRYLVLHGQKLPVSQGRQWRDQAGLHVLVMLPGEQVREILLRAATSDWVMLPAPSRPTVV